MKLMKNLLFILCLITSVNVFSQYSENDEYFDWRIGVSKSYIDLHAGGLADIDDFFNQGAKGGDFDTSTPINGISVAKSIFTGLSAKAELAVAKNSKSNRTISGKAITSIKVGAQYDLSIIPFIKNTTWLDPYINVGTGYFSFDETSQPIVSIGGGINFWFNESLGLYIDTSNNYYTVDGVRNGYFQHSIGLAFNLFKNRKHNDDSDFEADNSIQSDNEGLDEF